MKDESAIRLTWCPPTGEGFIVSPTLAELEVALLRRGAEFWHEGSGDGGLYFDVADEAIAELKLMFAEPDRFCVLHTDCATGVEVAAFHSTASSGTIGVRSGGNDWHLPRHYFVDRLTAWRAVRDFCLDGRCSVDMSWVPFDPPDFNS